MKKKSLFSEIILIVLFIVMWFSISLMVNAQESQQDNSKSSKVPKKVLIELFINADCTTCPKAAFCLEELAWSYELGKVIIVTGTVLLTIKQHLFCMSK
jgi:hypothetical protein